MPHQPYSRIIDGSDTAILFIHGIVGSPDHFKDLLPLVPPEWSVVNLLLPGHGGSVQNFSQSSMHEWRQYVRSTVNKLSKSHDHIILAGHSMGTLFCIDEALRRSSKTAGLFLLACPLYPRLTFSAARQSLQVAFGIQGRTPAAQAAHHACSIHATPKLWQYIGWIPRYLELFRAAKQGREQIEQISVPTIAVQSHKDELVARRACHCLENTSAVTLHVLPHSRHFYYPPEDLATLKRLFSDFLTNYQ